MKVKRSSFAHVLEQIGRLNEEDQQALVEILEKRLLEARRANIARDVAESNADFKAGKCRVGTPGDIMREILS